MRIRTITFLILLITCSVIQAQNLIPNGDFEQYSGCPDYEGQIDSALYWKNPTSVNNGGGTSDYLNQCATSGSFVGIPENGLGYQPARSGAGYGGILLYVLAAASYREYIETPFTSPLVAGSCYHFEMYINLANNCYFNTDDIGIYFSNTLISGITNDDPLPFLPQLNNTAGNFPDTLNWTLVSGNYTAAGGESYLIIGNFKDDASTNVVIANNAFLTAAYFYIDDVSLNLCTTGINETLNNKSITLYPNPSSDYFTITLPGKNNSTEIIITDITGKIIYTTSATDTQTIEINTKDFIEGVYLVKFQNTDFTETRKLIIAK